MLDVDSAARGSTALVDSTALLADDGPAGDSDPSSNIGDSLVCARPCAGAVVQVMDMERAKNRLGKWHHLAAPATTVPA